MSSSATVSSSSPEAVLVLADVVFVVREGVFVVADGALVLPEGVFVLADVVFAVREAVFVRADVAFVLRGIEARGGKGFSPPPCRSHPAPPSRRPRSAPMTTRIKPKPMPTHVDRTTTPYTGAVKIDATAVAPLLVNLPKGGRKGLRTAGPNIAAVVAELAAAVPTAGTAAGISAPLYASFTTGCANIDTLTALWQASAKLTEVLAETLALQENTREQQLSQIADAVRSTAKHTKNNGVEAPFQQTLAYTSATADKAAKTRATKKAATAAASPAAASTTTAAASPAAASTKAA